MGRRAAWLAWELDAALLGAVGAVIAALAWCSLGDTKPDFLVFHAAARGWPGPVYDGEFLRRLQHRPDVYPFAYPPSFLLILMPLRWLSSQAAYAFWVAASCMALVQAARLLTGRWAYLLLLSPIVFLTAFMGQSTLAVAALAVAGLALKGRPILSGVLLGLAACIKPQLLVLVPLGLLIAGRYRDLLVMILTGAAVCALSVVVFGAGLWREWLHVLPGFIALNRQMGLPGLAPESLPLRAALLVAASAMVWIAFRKDDPAPQSMTALGGALLFSEHVMSYDAVLIAPAALALALRSRWWTPLPVLFLLRLLLGAPLILALALGSLIESELRERRE